MMATIADDIVIEPGSADRIDPVMRIMEAAFGDKFGEAWTRSQLSGILPMAGVDLMIAVDRTNGSTIGFSLTRTVAGESELLLIAVLPERHREGIGTLLLADFLNRGRDAGLRRVHLEVRDGNPATVMYLRTGFSPVGRRRNYYHAADGKRYDAITLSHEF